FIDPNCACTDFDVTYVDQEVAPYPNASCLYFNRIWSVIFNCGSSNEFNYTQKIFVFNAEPPTISCPSSQINVGAESGCTAPVVIPVPTADGDCNTGIVITHNSIFATNVNGPNASGT